jgi:hypothetical protein
MLCKNPETEQKTKKPNLEQPTFYVNTLTKMLVVLHNFTSVQKCVDFHVPLLLLMSLSTFVSKHHLASK